MLIEKCRSFEGIGESLKFHAKFSFRSQNKSRKKTSLSALSGKWVFPRNVVPRAFNSIEVKSWPTGSGGKFVDLLDPRKTVRSPTLFN